MDTLNGTENQVYEYLREAITTKKLFPNTKIVEMDLARELGVSRTPIRAALKQLSYEGLIDIVPNKGAFVSSPSKEEIAEVFEAKKLIETQSIALASVKIQPWEIELLEKCLEQEVRTHVERDLLAFNKVNYDFHTMIGQASGNRYLEKYISELTTKSNLYLIFYDRFIETNIEDSAAYREHRNIIQALKQRDTKGCIEAMHQHLEHTYQGLNLKDM